MPNHCDQQVHLRGPHNLIKEIYDHLKQTDPMFCQLIKPMPFEMFVKPRVGKVIEPSKAKSSSKRQTRKSAADMVSTKTTSVEPSKEKIWSEKEIASMSMEEFDKYESEISEAMQQGRIVK